MRALCLWEVNRRGQKQAHEGIAEDGGDLADGLIERGVVFAHERSPWKTTHDDLRSAVETPSGGQNRRGRSAASVNYIRVSVSERPA
jgi:hypothetical protein